MRLHPGSRFKLVVLNSSRLGARMDSGHYTRCSILSPDCGVSKCADYPWLVSPLKTSVNLIVLQVLQLLTSVTPSVVMASDQVVLVTGASGDLGREIVRILLEELDASVVATDIVSGDELKSHKEK
jgi:hypothetical protein